MSSATGLRLAVALGLVGKDELGATGLGTSTCFGLTGLGRLLTGDA